MVVHTRPLRSAVQNVDLVVFTVSWPVCRSDGRREYIAQRDLSLERQRLVAKEQDQILVNGRAQLALDLVRQWRVEIHPRDVGADLRRRLLHSEAVDRRCHQRWSAFPSVTDLELR